MQLLHITSGQQSQLQLHKHVPPTTLHSIQLIFNNLSSLNILQRMAAERAWKAWRHRWVKVLSRPSNCATVTHHCLWFQEFSSQSLKLAHVSIISHWLNRLLSGPWHRQSVSSFLSFQPQSIITQMHHFVTKDRGSALRAEEYYCWTHALWWVSTMERGSTTVQATKWKGKESVFVEGDYRNK